MNYKFFLMAMISACLCTGLLVSKEPEKHDLFDQINTVIKGGAYDTKQLQELRELAMIKKELAGAKMYESLAKKDDKKGPKELLFQVMEKTIEKFGPHMLLCCLGYGFYRYFIVPVVPFADVPVELMGYFRERAALIEPGMTNLEKLYNYFPW